MTSADNLDVDGMSAPVANTGDAFIESAGNTTIAGGALPLNLYKLQQMLSLKSTVLTLI